MASKSFNQGIDYFALETATSNALKVKSSAENQSGQTATGPNTEGDAAAVDAWGDTAAPSAEDDVVGPIAHDPTADSNPTTIFTLGTLISAANSKIYIGGTARPVVLGTLSISTQNGSAPKVSASGQAVQAGASAALRTYILPAISLSTRHRAQDFLALCTIKKGNSTADPKTDYGLESVNGNFPIEFTLAQPKGVLENYDLHAGMVTVDYDMHWYGHGGTPDALIEPTIELVSSIDLKVGTNTVTVAPVMSAPKTKNCPENGYVQYTWKVSFPLIGKDA